MTKREDAVSEVIGGVLLIALVLIGAAIVGTYVTSQPLPEKIPRVQYNIKEINNAIYLEHEGGDSLRSGDFQIVIDGVRISDSEWEIEPDPSEPWILGGKIRITGHSGARSVGLVYTGGSGDTLLRSPSSPWGFGYVFPSFDPEETIDLPPPFPAAGEYGDLAWQ